MPLSLNSSIEDIQEIIYVIYTYVFMFLFCLKLAKSSLIAARISPEANMFQFFPQKKLKKETDNSIEKTSVVVVNIFLHNYVHSGRGTQRT